MHYCMTAAWREPDRFDVDLVLPRPRPVLAAGLFHRHLLPADVMCSAARNSCDERIVGYAMHASPAESRGAILQVPVARLQQGHACSGVEVVPLGEWPLGLFASRKMQAEMPRRWRFLLTEDLHPADLSELLDLPCWPLPPLLLPGGASAQLLIRYLKAQPLLLPAPLPLLAIEPWASAGLFSVPCPTPLVERLELWFRPAALAPHGITRLISHLRAALGPGLP